MTNLTTQWIVDIYEKTHNERNKINLEILNIKEELESLPIFTRLKEKEKELYNLDKQEKEILEQGKELMIKAWVQKFVALNWQTVQLNKTPWALVVDNEKVIPKEYFIEKTTVSLDKTQLKNRFKQYLN